jgi:ribosomal protein S17
MDKTVKVRVPYIAMLPKLKKRVVRNTILLVHDARNTCDVGDKVELAKSRVSCSLLS